MLEKNIIKPLWKKYDKKLAFYNICAKIVFVISSDKIMNVYN